MSGSCDGQIAFDYKIWSARYPQLADQVPQATAAAIWNEASLLILDSGRFNVIRNPAKRAVLLGLVTAHMAALNLRAVQAPNLVGRVSSASEGSVSVSTDVGPLPASAAYWAQTPWGLQFWQATAFLSQARYVPHPGAFQHRRGWL